GPHGRFYRRAAREEDDDRIRRHEAHRKGRGGKHELVPSLERAKLERHPAEDAALVAEELLLRTGGPDDSDVRPQALSQPSDLLSIHALAIDARFWVLQALH